ncbi:ankyrin repeat domain-containing protein [Nocardia sp. NPDC051750]|uniref:ankyrin repeat domain-containing protein n=1 Tax=Nocardia sp. NPDC051750 TaxID=3364325 RepID=UPI00379BCCD7
MNSPEQALTNAIGQGFLDRILELVRGGVDPNTMTKAGRTALSVAVEGGDPEIIRELLDQGADPAVGHKKSPSVLELAATRGDAEIVRILLDAGADPAARYRFRRSSLECAVLGNHPEIVRILLAAGADLYPKDQHTGSPLDLMFFHGNPAMVRVAVESGQITEDGDTPLHLAARSGSPTVVRRLIEAGADPDARNTAGHTPQDIAAAHHRYKIASLLVVPDAAGGPVPGEGISLLDVVADGRVAETERLLGLGADPMARTPNGWTALHLAARHEHSEIAQLLLAADAALTAADDEGRTALDVAVEYGLDDMTRLLREAGRAKISPRNTFNRTIGSAAPDRDYWRLRYRIARAAANAAPAEVQARTRQDELRALRDAARAEADRRAQDAWEAWDPGPLRIWNPLTWAFGKRQKMQQRPDLYSSNRRMLMAVRKAAMDQFLADFERDHGMSFQQAQENASAAVAKAAEPYRWARAHARQEADKAVRELHYRLHLVDIVAEFLDEEPGRIAAILGVRRRRSGQGSGGAGSGRTSQDGSGDRGPYTSDGSGGGYSGCSAGGDTGGGGGGCGGGI